MMSNTYDIVTIGSGHNRLVAAAYLAAAGKKTVVLERSAWFGGGVIRVFDDLGLDFAKVGARR